METGGDVTISLSDFSIDLEKLAEFLCQSGVGDEPITVIGIVGPTRSGKSFLMSMLVRYLQKKGWFNNDWIEDDSNGVWEGFAWREGSSPHTKGIKAWNRIFKIPCEDGGKRKVLLVDTQGLYCSDMTKEHNAKLFATMMLLCDDLLVNIERNLDERELESIEVLVKYASRIIEDMNHRYGRISSCQYITLLVRDWESPQDYAFGYDGGKLYVRGYLDMASTSEGFSVRQSVRSNIANIDGFLLPHPGVCGNGINFSGAVADMSPEFCQCIDELARTLFHPFGLARKTSGKEHMTGQELWSLMGGFSAICDEREVEKTFDKFKSKIDQIMQGNGNADGSYRTLIRECVENFGRERNNQWRLLLITKCQEYYRKVSEWGMLRELKADNLSLQIVHAAWTGYTTNMEKDLGVNRITDEELGSMHVKYLNEAEKEYENEAICNIAYVADHAEMLREFAIESYERFKKINTRRQGLTQLHDLNNVEQYEAQMFTNYLIEHFTEEVDKFGQIYVDEEQLSKQVRDLQSEFYGIFDDNWRREWPLIDSFKSDLLNVFESEHDYCMKRNSRNKVVFFNIIEECLTKAKVAYSGVMEKVMLEGYYEPADLQSHHEQARQIVTDQLRSELADIERRHTTTVMQQLTLYISAEYRRCDQENRAKVKPTPVPRSTIDIGKIWATIKSMFGVITEVITCVGAVVQKAPGLYKTAKATALSGLLLAQSLTLPQVLIVGALAITGIGAIGAIGYRVYRWYKNRQHRRMESMTA